MSRRSPRIAGIALLAALPATACSTSVSREKADREAYCELAARRGRVPLTAGTLNLDAADAAARPFRDVAVVDLDAETSRRLAATASREYRGRREDVYLAALSLSDARDFYRTKIDLGASVDLTLGPDAKSLAASPAATLSKGLELGGEFVLTLAQTFVRNLSSNPVETAMSTLTAILPTIPLSGPGSGIAAREDLTQAERDVLYSLRDYTRFQQEFAVRVASAYYRLLQDADTVENERRTEESLGGVASRTKALGEAGRLPGFQVDQAAQEVLRAQDRRVRAESAYADALDRFKLLLGLPIPTTVRPKGSEIQRLEAEVKAAAAADGPGAAGLATTTAAVAVALASRLDLANLRDALQDAQRRLAIAEKGLAPSATLRGGTASASTPSTRPFAARSATPGTTTAGLDLGLPTNRVPERNAYRAAEIDVERARRDLEQAEDEVRVAVEGAWRAAVLARRSFEIQDKGVALAAVRVDSANENLKAGRAIPRDVLEAEDALVEAKNARTGALVSFAVARLELERDLGTLHPDAPLAAVPAPSAIPPPK
jgi:outer membrane protein TolC